MVIKVNIVDAETDKEFNAKILVKKYKDYQFEIFVKNDFGKELRRENLTSPDGDIIWMYKSEKLFNVRETVKTENFATVVSNEIAKIKKVVSAAHNALATLKQL